jgi:hypothetical protein
LRLDPSILSVTKEHYYRTIEPMTVKFTGQGKDDLELVVKRDNDVFDNSIYHPLQTIGAANQMAAFSDGSDIYDGSGYSVAVFDDGVWKTHGLLTGKVIEENCFSEIHEYSNAIVTSSCANGLTSQTATNGVAMPNNAADVGGALVDHHGTMTSGAAAMDAVAVGTNYGDITARGVADGAKLVATKVTRNIENKQSGSPCAGPAGATCVGIASDSATLAALDYIAGQDYDQPVAAVNMSYGSVSHYETVQECQTGQDGGAYELYRAAIASLASRQIAVVVSTGNEGTTSQNIIDLGEDSQVENANKIVFPACVEGAVAVSATNNNADANSFIGSPMAYYANNGPLTTLLAPGGDASYGYRASAGWTDDIGELVLPLAMSNVASNMALDTVQGTSFSAPMVAGAYAVLREKFPEASVAQLTQLLQETGTPIVDNRPGYTVGAKPLINVNAALASELPEEDLSDGEEPSDPPSQVKPSAPPNFVGSFDAEEKTFTFTWGEATSVNGIKDHVFSVDGEEYSYNEMTVLGAGVSGKMGVVRTMVAGSDEQAAYTVTYTLTGTAAAISEWLDGYHVFAVQAVDNNDVLGEAATWEWGTPPLPGDEEEDLNDMPGVPNTAKVAAKFVAVNIVPIVMGIVGVMMLVLAGWRRGLRRR